MLKQSPLLLITDVFCVTVVDDVDASLAIWLSEALLIVSIGIIIAG